MRSKESLIANVTLPIGLFLFGLGVIGSVAMNEYQDFPGFQEETGPGRTKNAIASVVAGLVAQRIGGATTFEFEIQKTLWPDANVAGETTPSSIRSHVDLALTSATFTAQQDDNGYLKGAVDKSEFDWSLTQIDQETYQIARFGPKFDSKLMLFISQGNINGRLVRNGIALDWTISGTYDKEGNVKVSIDGPFSLGVNMNGNVDKR